MLIIFGLLCVGGLAGYLFRRFAKRFPENGKFLTVIVLLMLLCFGASIGGNPKVMNDIHSLGMKGLCFGVMALSGSAMACMLLQKWSSYVSSEVGSGTVRNKVSIRTVVSSMYTLVSFIAGILVGKYAAIMDAEWWSSISEWLLYLLVFTVALGIGNRQSLSTIFTRRNAVSLLIPLFSVVGTIVAGVCIGLFPVGFSMADCVCAVSGMGYYSLSSVLINSLKVTALGAEAAMQLGAIALVGNIVRELCTLTFAPWIHSKLGTFALIGASGVTSMDVCLPTITSVAGEKAAAPALVNGIILEISTPFLVTFMCMV